MTRGAETTTNAISAEHAWKALENKIDSNQRSSIARAATTLPEEMKAQKFVAQADECRTFSQTYPLHPMAVQAKQRECVSLALAALHGDRTQDTRREQLIREVRGTAGLTPREKFEAVAWVQQAEISRKRLKDRVALLAAEETLARQLIAEFPSVPDGYQSLLAVAVGSPQGRAQEICRELARMTAPAQVKAAASAMLERFALIGKPFASILVSAGAVSLAQKTRGRVLAVYGWRIADLPSQKTAIRLAKQAPTVVFIGVNLDTDPEAARRYAAGANLPGEQYYNARGPNSVVASSLKLAASDEVLVVNRSGFINDVRGRDGFLGKVRSL